MKKILLFTITLTFLGCATSIDPKPETNHFKNVSTLWFTHSDTPPRYIRIDGQNVYTCQFSDYATFVEGSKQQGSIQYDDGIYIIEIDGTTLKLQLRDGQLRPTESDGAKYLPVQNLGRFDKCYFN